MLGATSLRVSWTRPTNPNGLLISYTVRLSNHRRSVNASVLSVNVRRLNPYTIYSVTLTACTAGNLSVCLSHLQSLLSYYQTSTLVYLSVLPLYVADGGCTESPATPRRTKPATPDDVTPPVATPISRSYISVVWSKVGRANGPNVRYELTRMKLAQPLDGKSILSLL